MKKQIKKQIRIKDSGKTKKHSTAALQSLVRRKTDGLKKLQALQQPAWDAVQAELERTDAGASYLKDGLAIGDAIDKAFAKFHAGKLGRSEVVEAYRERLDMFRAKYIDRVPAALWKYADAQPSMGAVLKTLFEDNEREALNELRLSVDDCFGMLVQRIPYRRPERPIDFGTIQTLGGPPPPPPLGRCVSPSYAFKDEQTWSQLLSVPYAQARPGNGSFYVGANGTAAGGSAAHALVGADFSIPDGYSQFVVTADIDWHYDAFCYAVGGVAGTGADLMLRISKGDGSAVLEATQFLFSLLSPVVWGNGASGAGSSTVTFSFTMDNTNARTIRVLAGASAHAEDAAFISGSGSHVSGTVTKICITAS
jgi:hypothetical protein